MGSSNLKRKESNKKSSQKYYEKNKETENQKAAARMRKLRFNRAVDKIMAEMKAAREDGSSTKAPTQSSRPSTPTGDNASDPDHSERSVTPDHLRWPTPEYLRDYEWEAQMEALKKKNKDEDLQAEETEVTALLVLETGDEGDAMATDCEESSELEYVSDSEAYLLLSPPAGLQSP